jgi:hypothetical protein
MGITLCVAFFALGFVAMVAGVFLGWKTLIWDFSVFPFNLGRESVENGLFVLTLFLAALAAFNLLTGFRLITKKAGGFQMLLVQGLFFSVLISGGFGWMDSSLKGEMSHRAMLWDSYMSYTNQVKDTVIIDLEQVSHEFYAANNFAYGERLPTVYAKSALLQASKAPYNRERSAWALAVIQHFKKAEKGARQGISVIYEKAQ